MAALFELLLLLGAANGAPILARDLLGSRWAAPLDGGRRGWDGRPLLGPSKSWRGVAAALLATTAMALLLGRPPLFGLLFGAAAMAGDLLSSFLKRRLGVPSSGRATGLDQLPEALFPSLLAVPVLDLSAGEVAVAVAAFFVLEVTLSPLLFRLGLRDRPY